MAKPAAHDASQNTKHKPETRGLKWAKPATCETTKPPSNIVDSWQNYFHRELHKVILGAFYFVVKCNREVSLPLCSSMTFRFEQIASLKKSLQNCLWVTDHLQKEFLAPSPDKVAIVTHHNSKLRYPAARTVSQFTI